MQVPLLAGNYNRRTQGQEGQGDTYINQSSSYITIIILLSDTTSTKVSPFFLQHRYHINPLQLEAPKDSQEYTRGKQAGKKAAEAMIEKFKQVFPLAQASMAEVQQEQECYANRFWKESKQLHVGDKVWLSLGKHFKTKHACKKLDWKNAKYSVLEVIESYNVRLDTLSGPHNDFYID
jgi:hypothetical protein